MWLCYWQHNGVSLKGSHFWWATVGGKWRGRWGLMGRTEHGLFSCTNCTTRWHSVYLQSNSQCAPTVYSRPSFLRNTSQERRWDTNSHTHTQKGNGQTGPFWDIHNPCGNNPCGNNPCGNISLNYLIWYVTTYIAMGFHVPSYFFKQKPSWALLNYCLSQVITCFGKYQLTR